MEGTGAPAAPFRVLRGSEVAPRRQLALRIAGRIHDGSYGRGTRLPSVRALGERVGVHRGTVHAAYRELEREGLVRAVPGGGVFVREAMPPFAEILAPGSPGLGLRLASLGAALRLRRILVLSDENELGAIVRREIEELLTGARVRVRRATAAPLPGLDFGWLPLLVGANPARREEAGGPDGQAPEARHEAGLPAIPLRVGAGEGLLRRLAALRFPDVAGVISASPGVRRLLRETVRAMAGPDVGVVVADPRDGRAMRRVRVRASVLLTDGSVRCGPGRGAAAVPPRVPVRLVPAGFAAELLALFESERRQAGEDG